ncbi:hypothetical protein [Leptospira stimsonii]|uniref:Uncharacterized protein n=1 Tax=Leptospira stimsonii TaxID=2202203 RepID=A0ABY2MW95_9LEPT|nr:hypothetical protein [Leptospira stimsonii]TGK14609.1 hypothetical protein EHO98_17295 [Leptospira stimsonii]TGM10032.1 hypothetical protein EHQ90_20250 [Leptospira stimsonii]
MLNPTPIIPWEENNFQFRQEHTPYDSRARPVLLARTPILLVKKEGFEQRSNTVVFKSKFTVPF